MAIQFSSADDTSTNSTDGPLTVSVDLGTDDEGVAVCTYDPLAFFENTAKCVVCGTPGAVHRDRGDYYCEAHLNERLAREERPDPGPDREADAHPPRRRCIGLDT